jgi:hypothetical protein
MIVDRTDFHPPCRYGRATPGEIWGSPERIRASFKKRHCGASSTGGPALLRVGAPYGTITLNGRFSGAPPVL